MLAARLPGLLPPLSRAEALEVASIHSVASQQPLRSYPQRPFAAPHHTASSVALVGGGSQPKPGEISLAHRGILFLDELPEFQRQVLEVLREPLENGYIRISRASAQLEFPSRFQLIAAMNPCPCGYHGQQSERCRCTPDQVHRYRAKISGPLLDRIDIHIPVLQLAKGELHRPEHSDSSEQIAKRVAAAQQRQMQRQGCYNGLLSGRQVTQVCQINSTQQDFLDDAMLRLGLSARALHRLLKVSRTIADLAEARAIEDAHLHEALSYRLLDRQQPGATQS